MLSRTVHELLFINLVMSFFAYGVFGICLLTVPKLRMEKTLFLIMSTTIFFNVIGVEWLYKGLEQYTYITVRSLVFKVIALFVTLCLIRKKSDYVIYGALTIMAASASNILNFINAHKYIQMLVPLGKEKIVLYSEIIGAIMDLILNFILIPKMASVGAAFGTLVAEMAVWIVQIVALRSIVLDAYREIHYKSILVAILLGIIISGWVKCMSWGNFISLFGIYLLALVVLKEPLICEIKGQVINMIIHKKS